MEDADAHFLAKPMQDATQDDLRRELLRLHQFKLIQFDVAGSLVQLSMRPEAPLDFAEELVA